MTMEYVFKQECDPPGVPALYQLRVENGVLHFSIVEPENDVYYAPPENREAAIQFLRDRRDKLRREVEELELFLNEVDQESSCYERTPAHYE